TNTQQRISIDASALPANSYVSISGNHAVEVFSISANVTATISNLTITGGSVTGTNAGGINNAGNLTLHNVTLLGNTGGVAGGIFNTGTLTADNTNFWNNVSTNGSGSCGGALFESSGTVSLSYGSITGNSGTKGTGGISVGTAGQTATLFLLGYTIS